LPAVKIHKIVKSVKTGKQDSGPKSGMNPYLDGKEYKVFPTCQAT